MDRQPLILDWDNAKHARGRWLPTAVEFTLRDLVWLIVVLAVAALYGFHRPRNDKRHDSDIAALAAAQAAAQDARNEVTALSAQLGSVRDGRDALAARRQEDLETISNLRRQVSALQDEQRTNRGSQFAGGTTSRER